MSSILKQIGRLGSKSSEKRVIFLGTRKSSKTTSLGCLALACDLKSQRDKGFAHFIDEKTSGIRQVPSDLCAGHFPDATPPGLVYEADEYLSFKRWHGTKNVCLPFCETSGEDAESLIGPYSQNQYRRSLNWQESENLNKMICDSNGYVLLAPVNRPQIPFIPPEFLDSEPDSLRWDPDVNLARILTAIYRWKKDMSTSPEIDGIAVLLSKYDTISGYLKREGMNLYDESGEGARKFLQTYFRQTTALLKYYGLEKVKFFPVHVEVEKIKHSDGTVSYAKWPDGTHKIALDYKRNLPVFSEDMYLDLIQWIEDVFTT